MLDQLIDAVKQAGASILDVYQSDDLGIEIKSDQSPLTRADKAAHDVLVEALSAMNCGPILSEEDADIPWAERQQWTQYWLVDPLDGTKEFIKRNGEFTVNVALIRDRQPVIGLVYAPVLDRLYYAEHGKGAWRQKGSEPAQAVHVSEPPAAGDTWRVVGSRSHSSNEFDAFMAKLSPSELVSVGSSLKLCMVAEGRADLYPRLIPTSEWDTAAGQAVVEAAGGVVLEWQTRQPLRYNSKESLLNPFFLVCSEAAQTLV